MDWDKLKDRERGKRGEDAAPRATRRTLEQDRAAKAAEVGQHPDRAPSRVRTLTKAEIEQSYRVKVTPARTVFLDMLRAATTTAEANAAGRYGIAHLDTAERNELRQLFEDRLRSLKLKEKLSKKR